MELDARKVYETLTKILGNKYDVDIKVVRVEKKENKLLSEKVG